MDNEELLADLMERVRAITDPAAVSFKEISGRPGVFEATLLYGDSEDPI